MCADPVLARTTWRDDLPVLYGHRIALREPVPTDFGPIVDLLSVADATRFGIDAPSTELAVQRLLIDVIRDRAHGLAFTYAITLAGARSLAGLIQVRRLDPSFESAEWECTITPSMRGQGIFPEVARLVGSFAFGIVGVNRLEARVARHNGRANGAMLKVGAVQEGILRRSLRRDDQYFDQVLWATLKDDWGDHWVSTAPRVH